MNIYIQMIRETLLAKIITAQRAHLNGDNLNESALSINEQDFLAGWRNLMYTLVRCAVFTRFNGHKVIISSLGGLK